MKHLPHSLVALLYLPASLLPLSGHTAEGAEELEQIIVFGRQSSYFERSRDTALKMSADVLDTPFSVSVINDTMLQDLKATTLEDAYGYISGFSRAGTNANAFTVRGISSDLQNIQVDGLPGLASRFGSPPTANVERLEVLKGPASVLYGWMDPGGMINIITKKPEAESATQLNANYRQFTGYGDATAELSIDTTGALTQDATWMYRLVAGTESGDSFRDYVEEETVYLYPSVSWQPAPETRLDIQFEYQKEDRSGDDGLFVLNHDLSTAADIDTYYQEPGDSDDDEGYVVAASLKHEFSDSLVGNVKWRSVWHEDDRNLYESNSVQDDTIRRRNRHQYNEREYHFIDANLTYSFDTGITHDLLIGVNGGYEYRQYDRIAFDTRGANIAIYNPEYTGRVLEDDPGSFRRWNLYNYGLYAFDRIHLNEQWTLVAGLRADFQEGDYHLYYRDEDTTDDDETDTDSLNFSGGAVYQITPQASLYASYAQSFNPQTVATYDRNGEQLDPEQGEQFEIGFKLTALDERLNLQISGFDITREDVVENNGDYNEPVGEITSRGVEADLQYMVTDNLQLQAGLTQLDAEVSATLDDNTRHNPPAFAPETNGFVWMRYNYPSPILGGLIGASLGINYESERYTDEDETLRVRLPSYTLVDAGFYYERDKVKYALNLSNLTDEDYFVGGNRDYRLYPGNPREISVSAQFSF